MTTSSSPTENGRPPRLLVIGGVAGGASAAARARRLSESAEIVMLERGPDVSFANCGLPYHIGGEIVERDALAVQTPQSLKKLLKLDVRNHSEAVEIDRPHKRVRVKPTGGADEYWLEYEKLLLAPGASPLRPPLPGIDDPRIHTLRNLDDMDRIQQAAASANNIVVVGAGFIGLEMAEQFTRLGKKVTLVELMDQVLPQMDPKMTQLAEAELTKHGVTLVLGDGIKEFSPGADKITAVLNSEKAIDADLVLLSIGVRPDSGLAKDAELKLGGRGHIRVNEFQQTSDPDIYAAGDAVETKDRLTGEYIAVALGGPANRQGRVAADHIYRPDIARPYPGSIGTAIVRVFDISVGTTGWTEKRLEHANRPYAAVTINADSHAGYYPGAEDVTLKLLWDPGDGRILGAQATGIVGIDKRLDVLATAIAGGMTIDDLTHLELAYAPPFGSAKDPVNLAGFAATNSRDKICDIVSDFPGNFDLQVVDVRPIPMAEKHPVPHPGAINIPLPTLRDQLHQIDPTRPVITVCARGKTSYFAARILAQNGFDVKSFTGGMLGNYGGL
jgi:NADPH-dependent 2,4-dienoyl-CoA reductase/sulfur reductase-like enzyme/rhodanese-related sulfurtransferase